MNNKITKYCEKIIAILFFVIISFLVILSIFNTSTISISHEEFTYYIKDNAIRNFVILGVFIVILIVFSKITQFKKIVYKINNNSRLFKIIKYIMLVVLFLLTLFWILSACLYPEADQYSVQLIVSEMRNGDFSCCKDGGYLARYPFQSGLVILSYLFSLFFGVENYIALEIFNAVMIVAFYLTMANTFKQFHASNTIQLLIISSSFIFPIPLFYSYFIYGTIPGLALCCLSFYHYILFLDSYNNKDLILCIFSLVLALLFKTNYLIFAIALIITTLIKIIQDRKPNLFVLLSLLCISLLFQSVIPIKIIEKASGYKLDNGISNVSWIAMGLQESERAPGWYNGYNNDSYAKANNNSKTQKQLAINNIESRIESFNDLKYANKFFVKKIASQWNNPTFQVFWNLDGKISKEYTRNSWPMFFIDKYGQYQFQKYLNVIQSIILFGALIYSIFVIDNDEPIEKIFFELFFIGGFLFQLFWEGKAQYTFPYFVCLIPYSICGYKNILFIRKIKIKLHHIIQVMLIGIMIVLFVNGAFSFLDVDNKNYYNYIYDINE